MKKKWRSKYEEYCAWLDNRPEQFETKVQYINYWLELQHLKDAVRNTYLSYEAYDKYKQRLEYEAEMKGLQ